MTNMDLEPYKVIQYYCGRGNMENFIKEGKNGFAFTKVSSAKKIVNTEGNGWGRRVFGTNPDKSTLW